ncbi:protein sisterless A-like [Episyrphus balteatus]|uniref:protein sisterless A-like n=1 Tax=Episyrphus balteatus TaxID=286459 RepID=UPI0024867081|nr:protein sisterless A-like [Episyrphus balteatus]
MQHPALPDIFFKKVNFSETPPPPGPVNFDELGDYSELTPEIVDPVIESEIQRLSNKYFTQEEKFIDINLRENPIIWYNRTSTTTPDSPKPSTSKAAKLEQLSNCTRCKMLCKIKKAKFKLRYKFITLKLEKNAATLQNLRNCIASAEASLRRKGRSENEIRRLREAMGIDRVRVENLPEINRQFFRAAEKAKE